MLAETRRFPVLATCGRWSTQSTCAATVRQIVVAEKIPKANAACI